MVDAITNGDVVVGFNGEIPAERKCPKVGFNEQDGESYRCSLAKGHKGSCQPGDQV